MTLTLGTQELRADFSTLYKIRIVLSIMRTFLKRPNYGLKIIYWILRVLYRKLLTVRKLLKTVKGYLL